MYIDSHCHLDQLDLSSYEGKIENLLRATWEKGIEHILCVCIDLNNADAVLNIAKNSSRISASFGIHPSELMSEELSVEAMVARSQDRKIVAIGETGLDYYHLEGDGEWQRERFRRHIRAARELNKPLIIHTRQAQDDTLKIMQEENAQEVGGVMHCFTESTEFAQHAMELGFFISFSGIITFKNAEALREVVKAVPLDRILIETDAPYLAPVPFRGKPNFPAYVAHVAEEVASLKNISCADVASVTKHNFYQCFPRAKHDESIK